MEYEVVDENIVVVLLHNEDGIAPSRAKALVRTVLEDYGFEPWGTIDIDIFTGGEETLLIAKPGIIYKAAIADYALPFFKRYFTE